MNKSKKGVITRRIVSSKIKTNDKLSSLNLIHSKSVMRMTNNAWTNVWRKRCESGSSLERQRRKNNKSSTWCKEKKEEEILEIQKPFLLTFKFQSYLQSIVSFQYLQYLSAKFCFVLFFILIQLWFALWPPHSMCLYSLRLTYASQYYIVRTDETKFNCYF